MSRKVLALLVVLTVVGLAPATAVLGFCAKMPCCFTDGGSDGAPPLSARTPDCCSTVSCYEAPSHDLTVSAKAKLLTGSIAAVLPVAPHDVAPPIVARVFLEASPPQTTSNRLASLSVLLI